jgi:hypothetical protein
MLKFALRYARYGFSVFPLVANGKEPKISKENGGRGAHDSTVDASLINRWWSRWPDSNIGLSLAGLLVIDIDPRNGGDEVWTTLCLRNGEPQTLTARTGSGGLHYIFRGVDFDPKGKPLRGIDCKHGPGQYIVAAPSLHPNGEKYQWITREKINEVPKWLAALLRRDEPVRLQQSFRDRRDRSRAFQSAAKYLDKCPIAISGQGGHNTTFAVVSKVVRAFPELEENELWILLDDWNSRCDPPWSKRDLMHKISDALRKNRGGVAA